MPDWINPAGVPDGVPPDSIQDPEDPEIWHETPDGPGDPNGPPDDPDAGVDPDKSNPASPDYNPNWDPNHHNPDDPVPGIDNTLPIVDHTNDPNWVTPDYPDTEAPVSKDQQILNANALFQYIIMFYLNDNLELQLGATDLPGCRKLIRAIVLLYLGNNAGIKFQYKVLDQSSAVGLGGLEKWIDPSIDPADMSKYPADWDGWMNAEIRIQGGLGGLI